MNGEGGAESGVCGRRLRFERWGVMRIPFRHRRLSFFFLLLLLRNHPRRFLLTRYDTSSNLRFIRYRSSQYFRYLIPRFRRDKLEFVDEESGEFRSDVEEGGELFRFFLRS